MGKDFPPYLDYPKPHKPISDAEVRKNGKWVPWFYPEGFICTNCNCHTRFKTKFCPDCGADMREEAEDGEAL